MNVHHTKLNGDIAVGKTIADLMGKGFYVGTMLHEHLPFDLIAYKNDIFYRIQVKFCSSTDYLSVRDVCVSANGYRKRYDKEDFDYYAVYSSATDKIYYPSIKFGGSRIRETLPNSATPFYWCEDFVNFTDSASKKNMRDFKVKISRHSARGVFKPEKWIVKRPSKDELVKLLGKFSWSKIGTMYNVSDNAIRKWAVYYGINPKLYSRGKKRIKFIFAYKAKKL